MERKKVLLVDDVRLFLHLEETFFKRTGCEVLTAASGKEALALTESHRPDLILLDFLMPDMSGDQVCREIKASADLKDTPIMIVSTSASEADIAKCFAAGADDYVTKPINPQEVLAKAAALMKVPYRIHFRIPIHFKVQGETSRLTFTAFSRNISRGGILVECEKKFSSGAGVELQFSLPPDETVMEILGEVARISFDDRKGVYLMGIKFRDLPGAIEMKLKDFIDTRTPPPPRG